MTATTPTAKYFPGRAIFSALFVTLAGPLIGGLIIAAGIWLSADHNLDGVSTNWETVFQVASFVGIYSYILGIVQAAAAGAAVAFYVFFRGHLSTLAAVLASLFGTLVFAAVYTIIMQQDKAASADGGGVAALALDSSFLGLFILLGGLGLVAALVCRALLGLIFKQPATAATT